MEHPRQSEISGKFRINFEVSSGGTDLTGPAVACREADLIRFHVSLIYAFGFSRYRRITN